MIKEIKNFSLFLRELFHTIISKKELFTDEITKQKRLIECSKCDKREEVNLLLFKTHRCGECGCYLNSKTKFKFEECPIEKW